MRKLKYSDFGSLIFEQDWNILLKSLKECLQNHPEKINLVEIGCFYGATAIIITNFLNQQKKDFSYYGIEPQMIIPEANVKGSVKCKDKNFYWLKGFSFEENILLQVPEQIHWIFIDGCHCKICVSRDMKLYIPRLVKNGIACFHDASPTVQGLHRQDYKELDKFHDALIAQEKGFQVLKALEDSESLGLTLNVESPIQEEGGVQVYTKI